MTIVDRRSETSYWPNMWPENQYSDRYGIDRQFAHCWIITAQEAPENHRHLIKLLAEYVAGE